jgi:integrase/recombinase XerC
MAPIHDLIHLEEAYLNHHRALSRSPKSIAHHEDTFRSFHRFLKDTGRPADSRSLTTEAAQAFASWLRETPTRGWRGRTERSIHATHGALKDLRAFVRWLLEEELIDGPIKVPVPSLPQTLFPVLADETIQAIWESQHLRFPGSLGKRNRALLALMFDTGLRSAEVVSLEPADVDLDDQLVTVLGKGLKERRVPFSSGVALLLREWLEARGDEPGPLFLLKQAGLRMLFQRIREDVGLEVFHPHSVRHTAATQMLRANMDLHSVKRVLGHSHISTTERYLSLADQDLRDKHAAASPFERLRLQLATPPARSRRLSRH